jgi:2-oxoglutarate ferredoxin oxidoreductase subunit alpha
MATRGAGHGDGRCLTLAPWSVQELHDLTAEAFEIAERYRNPVMILSDAVLGQMIEPCRRRAVGDPPPLNETWAVGLRMHGRERHVVNSLYVVPDELEAVNCRIQARYDEATRNEVRFSEYGADDPEIVIVAYGVCARVSETAVDRAADAGVRCRLVRPISLFPFPYDAIGAWAEQVPRMLVVELSMGQLVEDVRLAVAGRCPVSLMGRAGGNLWTPEDVTARLLAITRQPSSAAAGVRPR